MDHLHSIMIVYVHLIFNVEVYKDDEDEEKYNGNLESKESYQRPHFKENDQFELDRESGILHLFMKYLLASYRFILIFSDPLSSIPTAIHEIESGKSYLHNDEIDRLITDEGEYGSSEALVISEKSGRNEEVK